MTATLSHFMLLVSFIFGLSGCSTPVEAPPVYPKGQVNPVTVGQLIVELESQQSNTRIYNFWATWCRPCLAEIPSLKAFGESHPDVEVVFVNVDQPKLHETRVPDVIERQALSGFRHLGISDSDPAYALTRVRGWPNSIPVTLVVDSKGRRVRQFNTRVNEATLQRAVAATR